MVAKVVKCLALLKSIVVEMPGWYEIDLEIQMNEAKDKPESLLAWRQYIAFDIHTSFCITIVAFLPWPSRCFNRGTKRLSQLQYIYFRPRVDQLPNR